MKHGLNHDGLREVTEGLKPDEWVVVGSRSRMRHGMTVKPERIAMPNGISTPGTSRSH